MQGVNQDIHKVEKTDKVQAIADHAEKFDPRTENLFRYLQASPQPHCFAPKVNLGDKCSSLSYLTNAIDQDRV